MLFDEPASGADPEMIHEALIDNELLKRANDDDGDPLSGFARAGESADLYGRVANGQRHRRNIADDPNRAQQRLLFKTRTLASAAISTARQTTLSAVRIC